MRSWRFSNILIVAMCIVVGAIFSSCNNDTGMPRSGGADTEPPVPGTDISFPNVTTSSVVVEWGLAWDEVTPADSLEYKLVKALAEETIDTLGEADAVAGRNLILDWTQNIATYNASDLKPGTEYFFAVLVRDAADNQGFYYPVDVSTLDAETSPPTPGADIYFSNVANTSLTVNWGPASDETPTASLEYKVVMASTEAEIDEVDKIDKVTDSNLIKDWTPNITTCDVSDLDSGIEYYFAVLVRDEENNKSFYYPADALTEAPPVPGTGISVSNIALTSLTLTWGAASDAITTDPGLLEYKVVRAPPPPEGNEESIDTIAEANNVPESDIVQNWTANLTTTDVTGLLQDTDYYFAVLVRDEEKNMELYYPAGAITEAPPDLPDDPITFEIINATSLTVKWVHAFDSITPTDQLLYKVVKSDLEGYLTDIEAANNVTGSDLIKDWTPNIESCVAVSLTPDKDYYFAVLVKDAAGNMSLYPELWAVINS